MSDNGDNGHVAIADTADFESAEDREYFYVDVPGWKRVYMRTITEGERRRIIEESLIEGEQRLDVEKQRQWQLRFTLTDQQGHTLYTDETCGRIKLPAQRMDFLSDVFDEHNTNRVEVRGLAKNYERTPTA